MAWPFRNTNSSMKNGNDKNLSELNYSSTVYTQSHFSQTERIFRSGPVKDDHFPPIMIYGLPKSAHATTRPGKEGHQQTIDSNEVLERYGGISINQPEEEYRGTDNGKVSAHAMTRPGKEGHQQKIDSNEACERYGGISVNKPKPEEENRGTIDCRKAATKYNGVFVPK